jgi:2'-5' RNA ligase
MRCFIAIDINEGVRSRIRSLLSDVKVSDADVRWVKAENIHLTLKFLGEIREELIEEMKGTLDSISGQFRRFSMEVKGVGVFPDYSRPRILWVGIRLTESLNLLFSRIERAMEGYGIKRETRVFRPHLTIGRIKSQRGIKPLLAEFRRHREDDFGRTDATGIILMKSVLKPEGAEYERLHTAELLTGDRKTFCVDKGRD